MKKTRYLAFYASLLVFIGIFACSNVTVVMKYESGSLQDSSTDKGPLLINYVSAGIMGGADDYHYFQVNLPRLGYYSFIAINHETGMDISLELWDGGFQNFSVNRNGYGENEGETYYCTTPKIMQLRVYRIVGSGGMYDIYYSESVSEGATVLTYGFRDQIATTNEYERTVTVAPFDHYSLDGLPSYLIYEGDNGFKTSCDAMDQNFNQNFSGTLMLSNYAFSIPNGQVRNFILRKQYTSDPGGTFSCGLAGFIPMNRTTHVQSNRWLMPGSAIDFWVYASFIAGKTYFIDLRDANGNHTFVPELWALGNDPYSLGYRSPVSTMNKLSLQSHSDVSVVHEFSCTSTGYYIIKCINTDLSSKDIFISLSQESFLDADGGNITLNLKDDIPDYGPFLYAPSCVYKTGLITGTFTLVANVSPSISTYDFLHLDEDGEIVVKTASVSGDFEYFFQDTNSRSFFVFQAPSTVNTTVQLLTFAPVIVQFVYSNVTLSRESPLKVYIFLQNIADDPISVLLFEGTAGNIHALENMPMNITLGAKESRIVELTIVAEKPGMQSITLEVYYNQFRITSTFATYNVWLSPWDVLSLLSTIIGLIGSILNFTGLMIKIKNNAGKKAREKVGLVLSVILAVIGFFTLDWSGVFGEIFGIAI